jgi:co-chaperonin GroES (HSP10)
MSEVLELSQKTAMTNTSGLEPLGRAVLVKHYVPEQRGMKLVLPDSVKERTLMVEQRAVVIAVGPACWPDEPARAAIGDRVMISKLAGYMAKGPADGEIYQFINDKDIFAKITAEEEK